MAFLSPYPTDTHHWKYITQQVMMLLLSDPFLMLWKGELDSLWFWPSPHSMKDESQTQTTRCRSKGLQLWLQSTLVPQHPRLTPLPGAPPALRIVDAGGPSDQPRFTSWLGNRRSSPELFAKRQVVRKHKSRCLQWDGEGSWAWRGRDTHGETHQPETPQASVGGNVKREHQASSLLTAGAKSGTENASQKKAERGHPRLIHRSHM